jgi:hypothetical protein
MAHCSLVRVTDRLISFFGSPAITTSSVLVSTVSLLDEFRCYSVCVPLYFVANPWAVRMVTNSEPEALKFDTKELGLQH